MQRPHPWSMPIPTPPAAARTLPLLLALLCTATALAQGGQDPTTHLETWPDGTVMVRYGLDEEGRKHGAWEEFAENGTRTLFATMRNGLRDGAFKEWTAEGRKVRFHTFKADVLHGHGEDFHPNGRTALVGDYRDGLRHGKWVATDESGSRRRTADYREGLLHGAVRIHVDGRAITRQTWRDGELLQLDELQPFPTRREALLLELHAILEAEPPPLDPADPIAAERYRALSRLQAYRRLCGLPFADMVLVPEWNLKCDAAAEACRRNGGLNHHPPKPKDMDDERFELAKAGAARSNLAAGSTLPRSVDQYMDDSDPSNIDRVGHRRWCLNPNLRKTGFGSDANYHAMWSMDGSGSGAKGLAAVYYPPRGYVPVDLFSSRRAFSIALLKGGAPKKDGLQVSVRALDEEYLPAGEPLQLDHLDVIGGGQGTGPCIVFRPVGLVAQKGRRYLVEVSRDLGRTFDHRYVVEFCAAAGGGGGGNGDGR